jgi:hypothetical protein
MFRFKTIKQSNNQTIKQLNNETNEHKQYINEQLGRGFRLE